MDQHRVRVWFWEQNGHLVRELALLHFLIATPFFWELGFPVEICRLGRLLRHIFSAFSLVYDMDAPEHVAKRGEVINKRLATGMTINQHGPHPFFFI